MPATPQLLRFSIGRLMAVIALLALEMAVFQRALAMVVIPPITMAVVSMNLAVLYAFRALPRSMSHRIHGMLSGGLISIFVLVGYYLSARPENPPVGIAGKALSELMASLAANRADASDLVATLLRLVARIAPAVEIVLLDLVGLAIIWAGGWLDGRRHASAAPPAAIGRASPSPLDDRAVTPL